MPDAVQVSVEEGLSQAAGFDLPPCLFNREPLPGVHLPVGVGFLIVHGDGEVEHEGVGGGEVMAVVKAHLPRFQADLLPHLAHGGMLGVLTPVHVSRHEDVVGAAVLFDENHLCLCWVGDHHAHRRVEHGVAEGAAGVTEGHIALGIVVFEMQLCAALHAVIHFHGRAPYGFRLQRGRRAEGRAAPPPYRQCSPPWRRRGDDPFFGG